MARSEKSSVDSTRSIKRYYAIAAIVMVMAIAANYVIMSTLISDHKRINRLNGLSGELRLSLFQVGLATRNILVELDKPRFNAALVERMQKKLHDRIINLETLENKFIKEASITQSCFGYDIHLEVDRYYFNPPYNLREKFTTFLERCKTLSQVSPINLKRLYRRWSAIDLAMASEGLFVQGVTELTEGLNAIFNNSALVLKKYIAVLNGLILIVLILEIVLIFKPLHKRLRRDQTELAKVRDDLKHKVRHDSLTGLPNRIFFEEQLRIVLRSAKAAGAFAIAIIDLNDFKLINDTYGHQAGDALLAHVGKQIRHSLRDCDYGFRLGGDEFALILDGVADEVQGKEIVWRVLAKITEETKFGESRLFVSASAGLAIFPRDTNDIHALLQMADQRMYQNKGLKSAI